MPIDSGSDNPLSDPRQIESLPIRVARLIRLPNGFAVLSNILAAQLVFGGTWDQSLWFVIPMSLAFYFAGMIGNDLSDVEQDRQFRPERVLPTGALSLAFAVRTCWLLNLLGFGIAIAFSLFIGSIVPLMLGGLLFGLIALYNGHAKHHWYGFVVMAACRIVNIYFVASHLLPGPEGLRWVFAPHLYPIGVGLYVGGVTWFASREEEVSSRGILLSASLLAIAGVVVIVLGGFDQLPIRAQQQRMMGGILLVLIMLPLIRTTLQAIIDPSPIYVQRTVGVALRSIIILDAFVCLMVALDQRWMAISVACLLVPHFMLSRRFPPT